MALERAGSTWTQAHAAAVAGYSPSFLRKSDCPKHYELGLGPHGKPMLVYLPAEVRDWKVARRIPIDERVTRRAS